MAKKIGKGMRGKSIRKASVSLTAQMLPVKQEALSWR